MTQIQWFKDQVLSGHYEVTSHADDERQVEQITMADIEEAINNGEIIEDYAERHDVRGHACLVAGKGLSGDFIHLIVAKTAGGRMRICTVYRPREDRFIEGKFRRPKL